MSTATIRERDPGFEPARPVMFATARPSEHDNTVPLISDRVTARCVDLFNVSYEILLLALERYFAHTEENDTQLGTLADATINLMVGVLAPLGQIITTLPVGPAHPGQNAGPSFELFYESDYLMPHLAAAWTMLEERLRQASDFAEEIQAIARAVARREARARRRSARRDRRHARGPLPRLGRDEPVRRRAGSRHQRASQRRSRSKNDADTLAARANETSPPIPSRVLVVRTHTLVLSTLDSDASRAASLLDGVLRTARAGERAGRRRAGRRGAGEQAPASDLDGSLWQLAIATATLSGAAGSGEAAGWLKLAAAKLGQLTDTLAPGAGVPTRPERQAELEGAQNVGDPTITRRAGRAPDRRRHRARHRLARHPANTQPAPGAVPLWTLRTTNPIATRAACATVSTTAKTRNASQTGATPTRESRSRVFDNRGICQHSGYCTDRLANVFHTEGDAFVTPSGGRMDEIINAVRACPSGALSYALGRTENRTHVDRDGTRPGAIEITRDGPYRITGAIALLAGDGSPVERAEGASHEHYALCRCGQSRNKPYCSGMHWYVDFNDPQPTTAANQTIYEAAGGMPALTRMTTLFYEKLAADDPLLAPLYATIPPSEPERLARELAWLTGAATDRPEHPGFLPAESRGTPTTEARERWVELMCLAARQARVAEQPELHATLRANLDLYSRAGTQT